MQLGGSLDGENKFRAYSSLLQQKSVKNHYKQNIEACKCLFTVLYNLIPGRVVEIFAACTMLVDKRCSCKLCCNPLDFHKYYLVYSHRLFDDNAANNS